MWTFSSLKGDIPDESDKTGIGTIIQWNQDGKGEVLDNINLEKGQCIGLNV